MVDDLFFAFSEIESMEKHDTISLTFTVTHISNLHNNYASDIVLLQEITVTVYSIMSKKYIFFLLIFLTL